jgi:hypothetical protein
LYSIIDETVAYLVYLPPVKGVFQFCDCFTAAALSKKTGKPVSNKATLPNMGDLSWGPEICIALLILVSLFIFFLCLGHLQGLERPGLCNECAVADEEG